MTKTGANYRKLLQAAPGRWIGGSWFTLACWFAGRKGASSRAGVTTE